MSPTPAAEREAILAPDRRREAYWYALDPALIAQRPVSPRDAARLLVYDRTTGAVVHERFSALDKFLRRGDLLVVNTTRVLPVRLRPRCVDTGKAVEVFLLRPRSPETWEALVRPGRSVREGVVVEWDDGTTGTVTERLHAGERVVTFSREIDAPWLDRNGCAPLPPYIRRQADEADRRDYQTVYADEAGAVAAPTAGLHFTENLLRRLEEAGIARASLVLHVGVGTFRPVHADDVAEHVMDAEEYFVRAETLAAIRRTRRQGARIVAVGTTTVRTLETLAETGQIDADDDVSGATRLFVYPPHRFRLVDALVTNFHLPQTTLLMLVSAFAGREQVLALYRQAAAMRYRFYSYGDAMLIT